MSERSERPTGAAERSERPTGAAERSERTTGAAEGADLVDEKVREGVEHLQNAALELIAAARVLLDLAEQAVRDPSDVIAFASEVAAKMPKPPQSRHSRPDEPAVQRIRVV